MKSRVLVLAGVAASICCGHAQAGKPPAGSADTRNVSGLETGDAGQSIQPSPANANAAAATALEVTVSPSVGWGRIAFGGALIGLGSFLIVVLRAPVPAVSGRTDRR